MESQWQEIESERVMVLMTARDRGIAARRLPDRYDELGTIAAIQIETEDDARAVLAALDRPGRTIYVDVERKQRPDLQRLAREVCQHSRILVCKPNDTIVEATLGLIRHLHGGDVSDLRVGIVGFGNIGFKLGLELTEAGAQVYAYDHDSTRGATKVNAVNIIAPRYTRWRAQVWAEETVDLLIAAAGTDGAVGARWVPRIRRGGVAIDVGIDNFDADFISKALAKGVQLVRADVRAARQCLPQFNEEFFVQVMGSTMVAGHKVAAGGIIGDEGTVIVDQIEQPRRVFGLANGRGGLLRDDELSAAQRKVRLDVERALTAD